MWIFINALEYKANLRYSTGSKIEKTAEKQSQRDEQSLIVENAILKERIALLNGEIEKLRTALTSLM